MLKSQKRPHHTPRSPQKAHTRKKRQPISIIGAGRMGTALGLALKAAGYQVEIVVTQRPDHARRAAKAIGGNTLGLSARHLSRLDPTQMDRLNNSSLVLIATPDQPWERVAMPICEGPQVLKRNGDTFVVYSASGSWTPDYCLGMLHNKTKDVLNATAWVKHGPVFKKTDQVWGVGHRSFVKSLCQSEDWIIYHSKSSRKHGWEDRDVHAKRFTWSSDGLPDFGDPLPRSTPIRPTAGGRPRTLPLAA